MMGKRKWFDRENGNQLQGSTEFAETVLGELPVPDGLDERIVAAMADRRRNDDRKAAERAALHKKGVMRAAAVAAILALVIGVTPLRGYAVSAAQQVHNWLNDVFDVNKTKKDNGVKVKLVDARLANEFLYVTLKGVNEELGETDLIYIEGTISDNQGHTVAIRPRYYQGGKEKYAIYIPDLGSVINSYDKKYTCDLKVTVSKASYTIDQNRDSEGFTVMLIEDEFNQTAVLNYHFEIKKIGAVMNFKSYDIERTMEFRDEMRTDYQYHGIQLTFKKMMVSDICTNIVAEITPPEEGYEGSRWFDLCVVMKDGRGGYREDYFYGSGTFYSNDKTYVVLDYNSSGGYWGDNNDGYITEPFAYEPPYEFEVSELTFNGITFEEHKANYATLGDVVIPVTYQGYKLKNNKTGRPDYYRPQIEPTSFQVGRFQFDVNELDCDGSLEGCLSMSISLPHDHFGLQKKEGSSEPEVFQRPVSVGYTSSLTLAAEKKGKEMFRFELPLDVGFAVDGDKTIEAWSDLGWARVREEDGDKLSHPMLRYAMQEMGIDALRVVSVNLFEETYTQFVEFKDTDWNSVIHSEYAQQYIKDDKVLDDAYDWDVGDFGEATGLDLLLADAYHEETDTYDYRFGLRSSRSISVTNAYNTDYCDVDLKALQKRGTFFYGTWSGCWFTNPFCHRDLYQDDETLRFDMSRWNREAYSFTVK